MRKIILGATVLLGLIFALPRGVLAQIDQPPGQPPGGIVLEYPNPAFPSIQSAIDSLRDGDTLRIAAGIFPISEPLIVGKRVIIEGAGCADLSRGHSGNTRETHLAGPLVRHVVAFDESVGLINYREGGGGALRGVRLSGFDAGVRGLRAENPEASDSPLILEDVCIRDTARGIAWSRSFLSAKGVLIQDVLWSGASVFPPVLARSLIFLDAVEVRNALAACLVFKNAWARVTGKKPLVKCGALGGIRADDSLLEIQSVDILFPTGPGIVGNGGGYDVGDVLVHGAAVHGILFKRFPNKFLQAQLKNSHIQLTKARPDGFFGDGLTLWGGTLYAEKNVISASARAGISNFGGFLALKDNTIECAAFELNGEAFNNHPYVFFNLSGNSCGCPAPGICVVQSSQLSPPDPLADPL